MVGRGGESSGMKHKSKGAFFLQSQDGKWIKIGKGPIEVMITNKLAVSKLRTDNYFKTVNNLVDDVVRRATQGTWPRFEPGWSEN